MNDSQWDAKLKSFLKKTGDDFKRFGAEVKEEAHKLLVEVQDPARQQKLKEGLKDVGLWAKKTAEEVATLVESGVKKAEDALGKASERINDFAVKPMNESQAASTPPAPPPEMEAAPVQAPTPVPPPATRKTVGRGDAKKRSAAGRSSGTKKTIGKRGADK